MKHVGSVIDDGWWLAGGAQEDFPTRRRECIGKIDRRIYSDEVPMADFTKEPTCRLPRPIVSGPEYGIWWGVRFTEETK